MRILLINPNTLPSVTDLVASHVRRIAGDEAEFVPVTGRFGARYIASRAASAIAGHAALDALAEHVEGCNAVYLACFGDPGLAALKEISPVPVVGMAAGVRTIAPTGDRIADDPEAALADLAAACRRCVEEDGAETVILGGAALAGLAERIQGAVPVPVLCSVEVGTLAVLDAARTGGGMQGTSVVESVGLGPALARRLAGALRD